jgi:serine protease AprX
MYRHQLFKRLTTLTVLFSLCAALVVFTNTKVKAFDDDPMRKVSPDLLRIIQSGNGAENVRVIVQNTPTSSPGLIGSLLQLVGGVVLGLLSNLNIQILDIPANSAAVLAQDPSVTYISLDATVKSSGHLTNTTGAEQSREQQSLLGSNNELDGSGVGIAIIDSGIDATHKSIANKSTRVSFSKDFTGENRTDDPYGHGTHVAAIAAGDGSATNGAYEGIAPAAKLINLRVLDSHGVGRVSGVLSALDWLIANRGAYNIRVVNMSLGTPAINSYKDDPICNAVRKLVNAGVVVIAAAGNNGKDSTGQKIYGGIHCPGNEPAAITVGASNSYGTDQRNDDAITSYSSRGPTRSVWKDSYGLKHYDNIIKPDLVAPGNKIISAEAINNELIRSDPALETNKYSATNMKLMYLSGTSMSAPVVSGAAALLLEANSNLTPNMIKMLLMYTAQPLAGFNTLDQGAGELNIAGAVALAKIVRNPLFGFSFGSSLLTKSAPSPQSSISDRTFSWSQGLILNRTTISGKDLINKYQVSYGKGYLLGDGIAETNLTQSMSSSMWTRSSLTLGSSLMRSDGTSLNGGSIFLVDELLLGEGFAMGDGYAMGDGALVGDGFAMGDVYGGSGFAMGDSCREGDLGAAMN